MPYKFNPFTGTFDDSTAGPAGTVSAAGSGTAALPGIAFASDPNTGIYNPGADQLAVSTGGTGRLFVDANGFVGIGAVNTGSTGAQLSTTTTSSTARLIVASTNAAGYTGLRVANGTGHWEMQVDGANQGLRWLDDGSERLRITSAGLVGIGTSNHTAPLTIGYSGAEAQLVINNSGGNRMVYLGAFSANEGILRLFNSSNVETVHIAAESTPGVHTYFNAGNVGIGTTSPTTQLEIASSGTTNALISAFDATASRAYYQVGGTTSGRYTQIGTDTSTTFINDYFGTGIAFQLAATERARIDSSGRLLIGTSSARAIGTQSLAIQNEGISFDTTGFSTCANRNDIYGPYIHLGKSRGTSVGSSTIVQSGDILGGIVFAGADGTDVNTQSGVITCEVDGTPGANDMPGRLVFSTTADGASSPTERMRITSDAYVRLAAGTGGIQFNGDTAAANALDDYEEGTWTPVPSTLGATTQPIYTSSGRYLKIGKLVYLTGSISVTTASTGAVSQTRITGIPFNMGGSGSGLADYQPQFTVGAYSAVSSSAADSSTPTGAYVYETVIYLRSLFGSLSGGQVNHGWNKVGNFSFALTYYLL